jgi:hypothetical protein
MKKVLISVIGFVLCFSFVGSVLAAGNATFEFEPAVVNTDIGDTFTIDIIAYPNNELIDTARAMVDFDSDALELQYYELGQLFPNVSPGNYGDNSDGYVYVGGHLKAEQTSGSGVFATLAFKSKLAGTSTISFIQGTKMISIGDERINLQGSGTASVNVYIVAEEDILEFSPVVAEIDLPGETVIEIDQETGEQVEVLSGLRVTSLSHANQNVWLPLSAVEMQWEVTGQPTVEIEEYYYSFDKEPQTDPGTGNSTQETLKSFDNVEDGIWYFHIKALFDNGNYSDAAHYRLLVDSEAPSPVVPVLDFEKIETGKGVYLRFRTTDQASGVGLYEIEINDTLYATGGNEMLLSDLEEGKYPITVKAYDKAGNWSEGTTELTVGDPEEWSWLYTAALILLGLLILPLIYKMNNKLKK